MCIFYSINGGDVFETQCRLLSDYRNSPDSALWKSIICVTNMSDRQTMHSGKTTHQHILVVSLLPGSGFGGREIPAVIVALVIIIIITITIIIIMIITWSSAGGGGRLSTSSSTRASSSLAAFSLLFILMVP